MNHMFWLHCRLWLLTVAVFSVLLTASLFGQNVISINFVGGGGLGGAPTSLAADETAGVIAVSNWNNVAQGIASGTASSLLNNSGTATAASVQWSADNTWSTSIAQTDANFRMMKGYLDNPTHDTVVAVSNVPYANYDMYVYCDDDNTGNGTAGYYKIGGDTRFAEDSGTLFSGTFTEAFSGVGNYVVFPGISSNHFTLTAQTSILRAPVNALQIVDRTFYNDTCAGAVYLSPGITYTENTTYAVSIGDPVFPCTGNPGNGVWFQFTPASNGPVVISTCGSEMDTILSVYSGTCGSLTPVPNGCNDDEGPACPTSRASVLINGLAGTNYWVLAGNFDDSGNLSIRADYAPINDQCSGAIALSPGIVSTMNTASGTSFGDPLPSCYANPVNGVWYKIIPGLSGPVTVSTCGSDFDSVLTVYTGICGSLTEVPGACNDNNGPACSGSSASVSFNAVAGTTYWILAGGHDGETGNLSILGTLGTPPANDQCSGAIAIDFDSAYTMNTATATSINDPIPPCSSGPINGVWYKFTVPSLIGPQRASVTIDTSGSDFPVQFAVYGDCNSSSPFNCNPPFSFEVGSGTYYVLVGGTGGAQGNLHFRATLCMSPILKKFDVSQSTQPDGVHVTFCADVYGNASSYVWSLGGLFVPPPPVVITNYSEGNCFTVVVPFTNEAPVAVTVTLSGCGGAGETSSSPGQNVCAFCLTRGAPGLLTGNVGSFPGPSLTNSCGILSTNTHWYKMYISDTGLLTISTSGSSNVNQIAVYGGDSLVSITNIVCVSNHIDRATFNATSNTAYWFAVDPGTNSTANLRVATGFEPSIQSFGLTNGAFELKSTVALPVIYQVLASTNLSTPLSNWPVIYTTNWNSNYSVTSYRVDFYDTNVNRSPQKFYRLVPGP